MKTTFLFTEQKNLEGLVNALKDENLENAKVFINTQFINELAESADNECIVKDKIKAIVWNKTGFIDYDINESKFGNQIYRINLEGETIFLERGAEAKEVIVIQ